MPLIPLDLLDEHPDNANRMSSSDFRKLVAALARAGRCPPLIVRPRPGEEGRYQILDGHHRARALRELGRTHAACEIWSVDEVEADSLLLSLNRLRGHDDPYRRAVLIERLSRTLDLKAIAARVPENRQRLEKLLALNRAPEAPAAPPSLNAMPIAVTFFLSVAHKQKLDARLAAVARDRSAALIALLGLDE